MDIYSRIIRAAILLITVPTLFACGGGGGGGGNNNPGGPLPGDFVSRPSNGEAIIRSLGQDRSAYYRFEGERDVTYAVSLTSQEGDADVAAFSGVTADIDNVIVYSLNIPDGFPGPEDLLVFTADETQTYYLEVYASIASTYQISISPATDQQIGLNFDRNVVDFISVSAPTVPSNQYVLSPIATTENLIANHVDHEITVLTDASWLSTTLSGTDYSVSPRQTGIALDILSTDFSPGVQTAQVSVAATNNYNRSVRQSFFVEHHLIEPPFTFDVTSPATVNYGELSTSTVNTQGDPTAQAAVYFGPAGMEMMPDNTVQWIPNGPIFKNSENYNWAAKVSMLENNILISLAQDVRYEVIKSTDYQPFARSGMSLPLYENNLLVGDFNGDTLNEIVVSGGGGTAYAKQVQVLSFDGNTYKPEWIYPLDLAPGHVITSLATQDTNNDNINDIIVATGVSCTASSSCYSYLSNETRPRIWVIDGSSKQIVSQTTDNYDHYGYVVTGDFNNDGADDIATLVVRNPTGVDDASEVFLNVYDAATLELAWQSPAMLVDLTYSRNTTHLAVGDIDNDGVIELVAASGYIYGYNPTLQTYQLEWNNNGKFGSYVTTGDINDDGIADVVTSEGDSLSAFEFVQKNMLFSTIVYPAAGVNNGHTPLVANIDNDPQNEILFGTTVLSYDPIYSDVNVDQYDTRFDRVRNLVYGDVDNDGISEIVFQDYAISDSILFVTSPDIDTGIFNIEWFNNFTDNMYPPYTGAIITEPDNDGPKVTFASFMSWDITGEYYNSSYQQERSGGLIYLDPISGLHDVTPPLLGANDRVFPLIQGLDFDGDTRNELYVANPRISNGEEVVFDPETQSLLYQSIGLDDGTFNESLRSTKADFNNDQVEDIITIDWKGRITIKDILNGNVLAQTEDLSQSRLYKNSVFVRAHDIVEPLDGVPDIVLAFNNDLYIYQYNSSTQTISLKNEFHGQYIRGLAVGDLEGDSNTDIVLSFGRPSETNPYNLLILDSQLNEVNRLSINYFLNSAYIEDLGAAKKNILFLTGSPTIGPQNTSRFLSIDPVTGRSIWQSPFLLGTPDDESVSITDITQDGDYELLMGTDQVVFVTR